jgi:DNA sulfur modification protein DndD
VPVDGTPRFCQNCVDPQITPFGRLDEVHTTKVVQALPSMADQVLLLVYESELDPNQARNELKGKLRKEYRIARRSARQSELETMS